MRDGIERPGKYLMRFAWGNGLNMLGCGGVTGRSVLSQTRKVSLIDTRQQGKMYERIK
jgi:hypothetical protein